MTDYKVYNTLNGSIVSEFWDEILVTQITFSCRYHGGDILQYIVDNKLKIISRKEFIQNRLYWLKGGIEE